MKYQVIDVSAITGKTIHGTVTSWVTRDGPYLVEHLAGVSADGDLLVFWWSPQHDWQVVNVSQKTGVQVSPSTVTSWVTPDGPFMVEHLAGITPAGELIVFWWSPRHDWQAVNVSAKTGRTLTPGAVTDWRLRDGPSLVEHVAGVSPEGELLVFRWSPEHDWQVTNVSAPAGLKLTAGSVTSWTARLDTQVSVHVAGVSSDGDLLVFWCTAQHDWQVDNISLKTNRMLAPGPVASWLTKDGPYVVHHLAGAAPTGELLVFWWSERQEWRVVDVTSVTGQMIDVVGSAHQVQGPNGMAECLSASGLSGNLLLFWWTPPMDWQVLDITAATGPGLAAAPVSWLVRDGDNVVEHWSAESNDGRLLVWWGNAEPRTLTDAIQKPYASLTRTRGATRKALAILWDPAFPDGHVYAGADGLMYRITETGHLLWFKHLGVETGEDRWVATQMGSRVGEGWDFRHVCVGDNGELYAISHGGSVYWFTHAGYQTGAEFGPSDHGKVVRSSGTDSLAGKQVVGGPEGVLYRVTDEGALIWYRHTGVQSGDPMSWDANSGQILRSDWSYRHTFYAGGGILYAIDHGGNLFWHKHDAYLSGGPGWTNDGKPVQIGTDWFFPHVLAGRGGAIYAVDARGDLWWYRHTGRELGKDRWDNNGQGKRLSSGWRYAAAQNREEVRRLLFGEAPSVRSYLAEVSGGHLALDEAKTVGWYLPRKPNLHYFGAHTECDEGWTDVVQERYADALRSAAKEVDFASYKTDPSRIELTSSELAALVLMPGGFKPDAFKRDVTTETRSKIPEAPVTCVTEVYLGHPPNVVGLVAHELLHQLVNAQDMYFEAENTRIGLHTATEAGPFSMMAQHFAIPHLDPFHKLKLGWLRPRLVLKSGVYVLRSVASSQGVLILLNPARGSSGYFEYFIVENRWPSDHYDKLPDSGLAVWHVVEDPAVFGTMLPPLGLSDHDWARFTNWDRRAVQLVRPTLAKVPDNSNALWSSKVGFDLLSDDPDPQHGTLRWADGTASAFALRSMSAPGETMSVTIDVPF